MQFILTYLVSSSTSVTTSSWTASWWSWSFSWSILQSGQWQDTFGNVQFGSQEFNTFISQGVVVVLPWELSLDVTFRSQRLQSFDDEQVSSINFIVLWLVKVFLSNNDTLYCTCVSISKFYSSFFCLNISWNVIWP